ncbi:hypothetical protein VU04_02595 [Desulfobulbus sp. TB]|nr:hypothetical protein [Desulfobulbus sp. TB]
MKIKSIEIKNIKGIASSKFELDIIPNKPNLIVAPNGFGKSSIATAFSSLNANRIALDEKEYHKNNNDHEPEITLVIQRSGEEESVLTATSGLNNISSEFDIQVINNQLIAKATKMRIGPNVIAKPSMEIAPIELIGKIPPKEIFNYSRSDIKNKFGKNGKILPNATVVFSNYLLLEHIQENIDLSKFNGKRIKARIEKFISVVNDLSGTTDQTKNWIEFNNLNELQEIDILNELANIMGAYEIEGVTSEVDLFLHSLVLIFVFQNGKQSFNKAYNYLQYQHDKKNYEEMFSFFNTSWLEIKPKETKKKVLVLELPKAHQISNGQRDILCFVALLEKSKRKFRKEKCILIIDEVFDYLDEANLVTVQYYISNLIEKFKIEGRQFYPLIMTHLNPFYFNHFCFNKHKIKTHYLDKRTASTNTSFVNIIKKRRDTLIKENVDLHHFHYHPETINIRSDFKDLGLKETWGQSDIFHRFIESEVTKYINDQDDYDPLAVCLGVRIKIENLVYGLISDDDHKEEFILKHGTKKKMEYAENIGIEIPEFYYLLGLIYNIGMHWHNNRDNISPIAVKLENLTIRQLISELHS